MNNKIQVPSLSVSGFQLIKETLNVYFNNFIPISIIVLLIAVPVEIIKNYYFVPLDYEEGLYRSLRRDGFVSTVFLSLITPTIIFFLFQKLLGSQISIINAFVHGLKTWPKVIGYGILKNIIVIAGLICLVIPGILFIFRLLFIFIIITIEGTKGIDPISVSNQMAKGRVWKLIFYSIILTLIIALPMLLISLFLYILFDGWVVDTIIDLIFDLTFVLYTVMALVIYIVIKNHEDPVKVDSK